MPFHRIVLDRSDVDERLNKDLSDYVRLRVARSRSIAANIAPAATATSAVSKMLLDGGVGVSGVGGAGTAAENTAEARLTQFLVSVSRGCFLYVRYD